MCSYASSRIARDCRRTTYRSAWVWPTSWRTPRVLWPDWPWWPEGWTSWGCAPLRRWSRWCRIRWTRRNRSRLPWTPGTQAETKIKLGRRESPWSEGADRRRLLAGRSVNGRLKKKRKKEKKSAHDGPAVARSLRINVSRLTIGWFGIGWISRRKRKIFRRIKPTLADLKSASFDFQIKKKKPKPFSFLDSEK